MDKRSAHRLVEQAVRSGSLVPAATCELCGAPVRLDGHHGDYDEPYEVRWLCPRCHIQEHPRRQGPAPQPRLSEPELRGLMSAALCRPR